MATKKSAACKRPYTLGRRLENSDQKRAAILGAARSQLESNGFLQLTMDSLARASGVTRQTVHNLFGTKTGVLEALFDQLALDGGMERMRAVMQQTDTEAMLAEFAEVFTGFWAGNRLLLRRIHGIAAIDPELGAVLEARNQRRQMAAARVVDQLGKRSGRKDTDDRKQRIATLYALTSFEFFDALAESCGGESDVAGLVLGMVNRALVSTA
ncbi:MAG: helix-turn-helix domain-containing protein [Bryobacteraceae bacterium]